MCEEKYYKIGEVLDKIMTTDVNLRGSIDCLYKAARENAGMPLSLDMAKKIEGILKPKDTVIFTSGWMDQPEAAPGFAETDGPIGTVALAKALRLIFKVKCIIFTDEETVEPFKKVAQAGGFHCVDPTDLEESINRNKLLTISILPFPKEKEKAKTFANEVLELYKPVCCISIERGGMNEAGKIHSMSGTDTSLTQAKIDYLFKLAYENNIPTFGIGDGGNEIGMANIRDTIIENVLYGDKCRCGCGFGIAPVNEVTSLLTATVSNWGCYAVVDMLAVLTDNIKYLYESDSDERLIKNAADNGFHDAMTGGVEYSVDGLPLAIHSSIVKLMREVCLQAQK